MPKISVIVPVYNTEKYLKRCLDSILSQSFKDFELIVADDGSTDKSGEIIRAYEEKNANMKALFLGDKNVSYCRNTAIKHATGEYVAFVDSDDYVANDYLERLYSVAKKENAEVVNCNFYIDNEEKKRITTHRGANRDKIYKEPKALRALIKDNTVNYYVWNKLFSRELILKHSITFPEMCFEDTAFSVRAFYYANKVALIKDPLYYYVRRGGSLVNTMNEKKLNEYIKALADTKIFLCARSDFGRYRFAFFLHSLCIFFVSIKNIICMHKKAKDYKKLFKNILKLFSLMSFINSKKLKSLCSADYFDEQITVN